MKYLRKEAYTSKLLSTLLLGLLSLGTYAQEVLPYSGYFQEAGVEGSFSLYDLKQKKYYTTSRAEFTKGTSPASTFKIPNTFIALEEKVIRDENEVLKWDGTPKWLKAWEQDYDLKNAYKNSTVWFYQELARRIGPDKYRSYLKKLDYGNQDISGGLTEFWLGSGNSLKISPKNQLEFLQKLQAETLPFSPSTYRIGKEVMVEERTPTYTLRAKTGWADIEPKDVGWYVGYLETADNVYFFATRIYKPRQQQMDDFGAKRKELTRRILSELKVL
ncbi:OXA-48 family carbapenem-hydrolyzing class D beta-lactamase OXA-54 [Rhabdobacter roseus]|uniref:beta-lactamase n=1 Tax=Rhabdobacter roseus TaxID=1655419 RepID=A0A840TTW1_9BACT|nr:class D beta-lactamase [Rhabdobacter roseus]MBB5284992.1 beta-lactamase class D [Rhabdobacter roseus]